MFITDRMVYGTMSEIGLAAIPPAYNPSLPVSPCKRWLALVLTLPGLFPFPVAGIHRFYVGKVGTGFLWLFTCGLLG
ncbi:MAG: TM2 domain-containing protein, partial [Phycisphaerae bacterium]